MESDSKNADCAKTKQGPSVRPAVAAMQLSSSSLQTKAARTDRAERADREAQMGCRPASRLQRAVWTALALALLPLQRAEGSGSVNTELAVAIPRPGTVHVDVRSPFCERVAKMRTP